MTEKLQLDIALLLPEMVSADACIDRLTERLAGQKGIEKAHVVRDDQVTKLCLHFDPNLVSLSTVERLARDASAAISDRYRHEQIAFAGLNTADAGLSLERVMRELSGMLHVTVNYAAGLIFVAYDTSVLQRGVINSTIDAEASIQAA
mgnify:CR=1 FL=1